MSIQSTSFNAFATQRAIANPTINSGINAGGVFDGQGNDFLDPNDILKNINGFSNSVSPVNSSNAMTQLVGVNPIAQNANSSSVLSSTNGTLNNIFSPNFGSAVLTPSTALNSDLANFNPMIWQNPNSLNVQLGIMDATNKIFGGNGLFQPNLVPPLYPYISTSIPYNNYVAPVAQQAQMFPQTFLTGSPMFQTQTQTQSVGGTPTGSTTQVGLAILQIQAQAQVIQQDITSLESQKTQVLQMDQTGAADKEKVQALAAQLQAQIDAKKATLQNLQQALLQLQAQTGTVAGGNVLGGQSFSLPYIIANSTTIFPYQSQVALMDQLNGSNSPVNTTGSQSIISSTVNGVIINQLSQPNGVPAWVA